MAAKTIVRAALAVIITSSMSGSALAGANVATIFGSRPVAEAIKTIWQRYGWVINYEDPPYANKDDIEDVTKKVTIRPLDHAILAPKSETLSFVLPDAAPDPALAIRNLVRVYNAPWR